MLRHKWVWGFIEYTVTCFPKAGMYVLVCGPSYRVSEWMVLNTSFQSFLVACHKETFSHICYVKDSLPVLQLLCFGIFFLGKGPQYLIWSMSTKETSFQQVVTKIMLQDPKWMPWHSSGLLKGGNLVFTRLPCSLDKNMFPSPFTGVNFFPLLPSTWSLWTRRSSEE